MLLILLVWTALLPLFAGIGALAMRAASKRWREATDFFLFFWVGMAGVLVFLILWNFIFPVTFLTLAIVAAAGVVGWAITLRDAWPLLRMRLPAAGLVLLVWLALGALIANQAMQPIDTNDTAEYHIPLVEWANAYRVVPGLGNLSTRYSNNNSYFLIAAMVNQGPFRGNTYQLINGLFLMAALGQCLAGFYRLLPGRGGWKAEHFFAALLIAPILDDVNQKGFISLTPDFAIFAIGIALTILLLRILRERADQDRAARTGALVLIAAAGVTIKITFLIFAAGACILAIIFLLTDTEVAAADKRRLMIFSTAATLVIGIAWMARGVILSGYPAFPSTLGGIPVDWQVPAQTVQDEANWVMLRARNPDIPLDKIITGPNWFQQWFGLLPAAFPRQLEFLYGILIVAVLLFRPARWKDLGRTVLFLVVPLAALGFWFATAPGPRFIGASLWIMTAGMAVLVLGELDLLEKEMPLPALLASGFLLWVVSFGSMPRQLSASHWLLPPDRSSYPAVKTVTLADGTSVFVPSDSGACWNTPVPCTSILPDGLAMREPGNLSAGFHLETKPGK